jgi:hypothetical protein
LLVSVQLHLFDLLKLTAPKAPRSGTAIPLIDIFKRAELHRRTGFALRYST